MSVLLRRAPWRAATAVVLAVTAAACGGGGSSPKAAAPESTTVSPSSSAGDAIPAGVALRIGDQGQFLQTLLETAGELDAPYEIEFAQFASGPLVNAAFTSGNIDLGFMGDTPASATVSGKIPVQAVGVAQFTGPVSVLAARPGISSVADLKGKKVAFTTGTAQHALALRALATVGLAQADVQQVDVPLNQLGTVLTAGQVDASVLGPADAIKYKAAHPDSVTLAGSDTLQPPSYLYFLATQTTLGDVGRAAAARDLIARIARIEAWISTHTSEWVDAYYVGVNHQDADLARQLVDYGGLVRFVELTPAVQQAEQQLVDLLAKAGAIPATFDVGPLYDPSATAAYNNQLKELTTR